MAEYQEMEKKIARDEALKFAITTLTKDRHKSSIARRAYVRDVKEFILLNGNIKDKHLASLLTDNEILKWESFYDSVIRVKTPQELRVAYLSGPNPENDIEILVNNGILPENIWAFESDNKTYSTAIMSALASKFPFIKLYKGSIEKYLQILSFKFDIIYLDFCSTAVSDNTLSVVKEIFNHQKLETLGVLITNFSLPNKENERNLHQRKKINDIASNYIFPKKFTEDYTGLGGGYRESAECYGITWDKFREISQNNEENIYSQFITRLLYDLPSVIIPSQKLANNKTLIDLFFINFDYDLLKKDEEYNEDLASFPDENSLVWGLSDFHLNEIEFKKYLNKFKKQLSLVKNEKQLMENIELSTYFKKQESKKGIYSQTLEKIQKDWHFFRGHNFCDLFLFHQLKDILIGQLTSPYYYNVEYTKRWKYKAKSTDMFMDLITYDECRYIFDWMPSIDMFEEGIDNLERQLTLRFAMDSVSKQRLWYNDEFFYGTSCVDHREKTFEGKILSERININKED